MYQKSNIIHFRKTGTKETNYMFKWGQVPLEKVNCYKYLGLYLFSDMNFSKTARFLSESSNKSSSYTRPNHYRQVGWGGLIHNTPGVLRPKSLQAGRVGWPPTPDLITTGR